MKFEESEKYFEKYRETLRFEAQRLVSFMALYRNLHERKNDRLIEMNISPAFFQITMDALFTSVILWVDKLLGQKSERGFVHFLRFIESNLRLFEISELKKRRQYHDGHRMLNIEAITTETINEDKERLSKLEALRSFKKRRDKFHAHFDKKYFFDRMKLGDDAPIKWGDLTEIETTMADIINRYSASYDGNTYSLRAWNITDVDRILDMLHKLNEEDRS